MGWAPQGEYETLEAPRPHKVRRGFRPRYKPRAGIEGTISQGTRAFELRCTRYIGLAKSHLQHLATASAMNLTRVVVWLMEHKPKAQTRISRFAALAPVT